MDSAQIWTIIGVVSTVMVGGAGALVGLVLRQLDVRFDALNVRMDAKFEVVDAKIDALAARVDRLDADMTSVVEELFRRRQE